MGVLELTHFAVKDSRGRYASLADRIIANSVLAPEDSGQYYDDTPCWIWTGTYNSAGYPHMRMRRKRGAKKGKVRGVLAHRMSIEAFKGRTLRRDQVCQHLCNNKSCVNPAHLKGGSQSSNMKQCVRDGRHNSCRAEAAHAH